MALVGRNLLANAGEAREEGSVLGLGRLLGGEGTAAHSSVLVWETPWTEEPGRVQREGLQRVGHDWSGWAHSHGNGLILVTVPDCRWPRESAGSGVPDERAYLHRLRPRHHPNHWQSEGVERRKDTLPPWGWSLGDVFIPQSCLLSCFLWWSAFLSFLPPAHAYLGERLQTFSLLVCGEGTCPWAALPRLGWGADHRETMALVGGQDGRAGGGERRGACMQLLLVLILCRNIAWLVELGDWRWCSASNCWTYSNFITCTTGVPFLCQDPTLQLVLLPLVGPCTPWSCGNFLLFPCLSWSWASLLIQMVKRLPAMWEIWVRKIHWARSIPGSGRSAGEGNGNPLQYSFLENSMDGGAWWAAVHGASKSQIQPSDFTYDLDTLKSTVLGRYFIECPSVWVCLSISHD